MKNKMHSANVYLMLKIKLIFLKSLILGIVMRHLVTRTLSAILIILGAGLCIAHFVSPHKIIVKEPIQVSYQDTENKETLLERAENYMIGEYSYSSYNLESGKTIVISWQADSYVIVYFMTESQYNTFVSTRLAQNLRSQSGMSGSFSYPIGFSGRYYVVIYNPNWFVTRVRVILYQSKLTWQETVTKYRTEYVPKEIVDNLYLYLGFCMIGAASVVLLVEMLGKTRRPQNSPSLNPKE